MKKTTISLLLLGLSLNATQTYAWVDTPEAVAEIDKAMAVTPDLEKGKELYQSCALCHSPEGWGNPSGHYPQIAGQHKSVIIKQIVDIRTGSRDNPTMYPFAQASYLGGADNIAHVAAYIEKLLMNPNNNQGSGTEVAYGESIYKQDCAECHKETGAGDAKEFYPRLQGQNFHYLVRQLNWIQIGKRRNADKQMLRKLHKMGAREIHAVADYISHLPTDPALTAEHGDWRNPDFSTKFRTANPTTKK